MGGKSKTSIVGYRIKRGVHGVVSTAPIDGVTALEIDSVTVWEGSISAGQLSVYAPNAWGGDDKLGSVIGDFSVLDGSATQGVNAYLASVLPAPLSAHRDIVSVVLEQMEMGKDPRPLPWRTKNQNVYSTFGAWESGIAPINPEFNGSNSNIYIAMDKSPSMLTGTRLADQYSAVTAFLENLKGLNGNSVKLVTWSDQIHESIETIGITTDAEVDALIAWVDALTGTGSGTHFDVAISLAEAFFATSPTSAMLVYEGEDKLLTVTGDGRKNIIIFLTDGGATGTTDDDAAADLALYTVAYQLFGFSIERETTTSLAKIDNTPQDGIPVVVSGNIGNVITATSPFWVDINPIHIFRDILLDPAIGGRWLDADIGTTFETAAQTLYDEGLGLSFLPSFLARGADFMKREIERHIDGHFYRSKETGLWEVKLVRDDYVVGNLITIAATEIIEWVDEPEFPDPDHLPNQVTLTYTRRGSGEQASITQDNPAAVGSGVVVPDENPPDYPGITFDATARDILLREMKSRTLPIAKGAVRITYAQPDDMLLGFAFILTDPKVGINGMVCRVRERVNPNGNDNSVVIHWVQDRFQTESAIGFADVETGGTLVSASTALAMSYEFAFEVPYWQHVQDYGQTDVDAALVSEPTGGLWIGSGAKPNGSHSDILLTRDEGANWLTVGSSDFSPYLVLSSSVDSQASSTTFLCTFNATANEIGANDLMLVDDEIVRIDTAVSDGTTVTLTVGRGCLDTVPRSHGAGVALMLWEGYARGDGITYLDGESVDLRLLPRTASDVLSIDDAATLTVAFDSRSIKPYAPGRLQLAGSYAPTGSVTEPASLTWVGRDRLTQTTLTPEDHADTAIGPESGVTYVVEVRSLTQNADFFAAADFFDQEDLFLETLPGELIREVDVGTDTSYSFSNGGGIDDFFAAADVFAASDFFGTTVDLFGFADFFGQDDFFAGAIGGDALRIALGVRSERAGYVAWQVPYVIGDFGTWSETIPGESTLQLFRFTNSQTQTLPLTTSEEIDFDVEVFTDGNFASNNYTVPASLDGQYAVFFAGMFQTGIEQFNHYIQVDDGGGFVSIAADRERNDAQRSSISSGPILLAEGDVFKVIVVNNTGAGEAAFDPGVYFAAHLVA